jgi:hypothetical protein
LSQSLSDLPDDVADAIAPHLGEDDEAPPMLDAIGIAIAEKRDEAKAARTSSGIEAMWREAEEAYAGIDDVNRHEFGDMRWAKPTSIDGPVTTGRKPRNTDHKSTVYLPLTTRYVDAGSAKLGEILLPADDRAFSFSEMPIPEVIQAKDNESQVVHSGLGVPLTRPLAPGEAPPAPVTPPVQGAPPPVPGQPVATPPQPGQAAAALAAPPAPPRVPLTVKDLAIENIELARERAKAAETRIYDWMVETMYRAELRKCIFDAARIGVCVLKAPTPKSKRVVAAVKDGDNVKVIIKQKIVPSSGWVDPWNIFPDPACGESIHDGEYVFERDYLSARQVRALKKLPGYIATQIDRVLDEGPDKVNKDGDANDRGPAGLKNKGRYAVWYFYGTLTGEEIASINAAAGGQTSRGPASEADKPDQVHAIVTLINDSVVKAIINPLDSGSFPYHSMPWQRRAQSWAGKGVGEQMKAAQKVTNAALRALLNNAGKSAGSQIVIRRGAVVPADGNWAFTPDKIWYATDEAGNDIRMSFYAFEVPNVTEELMKIIEMGERFAEETTSIPLITQGQSGATTPDTFGAAQLQNNNANQLLRSIGYSFDDCITEPVVRRYYEWLLLDPDVPNEEKGEFQIDAHGSIALVERAIQDQTIGQMGNVAANPIYGVNPKKWFAQYAKSKRLDPQSMQYTPEEQEKMDAAPPPEAPAVTVAKVNADTALKVAEMGQQGDAQSVASAERIEAAANVLEGGRVQNEQHRTAVDATVKLHELQMQHNRAMLEYANRRNISLDQAKAELAKVAMTLQTQRDLNTQDNAVDLHKHATRPARPPRGMRPPGQVPGRAGNGRAFEQAPPA